MTGIRDFVLPPELTDKARQVIEANRAAGRRLAVAESCTGGLVAAALTEIAGSSDVLEGGFITYSNESKMALLGISEDLVETFGAVSIAVAWAMAQGALKRTAADTAVAVTGIAGPGGGTPEKPVGAVFVAASGPRRTKVRQFANPYDRETFKYVTAQQALDLLRRMISAADE